VLLVSDGAVLASFIFAYLFLWTVGPGVWPPDGSQLPGVLATAAIGGTAVAASLLFEGADRLNQRDQRLATGVCFAISAVLAVGALAGGWSWLSRLSIVPTAHAYGATVWTLLGYIALHVAIGAAMGLWCVARLALGMIDSWRCLTVRVCLLWWRFTAIIVVATLLLVSGFPRAIS
jgi:cytochrome c oxidase subunit I+III